MSKRLPTIWPADPHTLAKIAILKGYLDAWVPILGKTFKQPLIYIDGFAGPGYYKDGEDGSPLVAIRAASSGIERSGNKFISPAIHLFFIEKDRKRHMHLSQTLSENKDYVSHINVHPPIHSIFAEALPKIAAQIPAAFESDAPVFLFADPFGVTGMPFQALKDAVRGSSSELLINLDADGVGRIYQASNNNREEQLCDLFGCDHWQKFASCGNDHRKLHREILALYKSQILTIPGMKYVWQFGMRGKNNELNYYLVFATKNPLGMEKMKEAMRRISQDGSYTFSDASINQEHIIFDKSDETVFSDELWGKFNGKTVRYSETEQFALNETPFINPKKMLAALEKQGRIRVIAKPNRRRETFPPGTIQSIEFIMPQKNPPEPKQIELSLE